MIQEIRIENLNPAAFIEEKIAEISATVGDGVAVNALSGGVDSAAVTMLGHKAIGDRLKTYFIENGLMRQDEPQKVFRLFADLGVHVEVIDAKDELLAALRGLTDPEQKREAVTQTFYKDVFGLDVLRRWTSMHVRVPGGAEQEVPLAGMISRRLAACSSSSCSAASRRTGSWPRSRSTTSPWASPMCRPR